MSKWMEYMGEDRLWVCQVCGSECDSDTVGETCPECGAPAEDEPARITDEEARDE